MPEPATKTRLAKDLAQLRAIGDYQARLGWTATRTEWVSQLKVFRVTFTPQEGKP